VKAMGAVECGGGRDRGEVGREEGVGERLGGVGRRGRGVRFKDKKVGRRVGSHEVGKGKGCK